MEHSIDSLRFAATARTNTSTKKKKKASRGWSQHVSEDGEKFFHHPSTGTSQWDAPPEGKSQIQVVEEEEQGGEEGDEEKDGESVTILMGERTKQQSQRFGEMSSDEEDDDDSGKYGSEAAVKPRLYSKTHTNRHIPLLPLVQQAYSSTSSGASSTPAPTNISTSTTVDDVGGGGDGGQVLSGAPHSRKRRGRESIF